MNRIQAAALLPIIQAFAEGKTVQYKTTSGQWVDIERPSWVYSAEYRIKPEPRTFYCYRYSTGVGRMLATQAELAHFKERLKGASDVEFFTVTEVL